MPANTPGHAEKGSPLLSRFVRQRAKRERIGAKAGRKGGLPAWSSKEVGQCILCYSLQGESQNVRRGGGRPALGIERGTWKR